MLTPQSTRRTTASAAETVWEANVTLREQGLYTLCSALRHGDAYLCGAHAIVLVCRQAPQLHTMLVVAPPPASSRRGGPATKSKASPPERRVEPSATDRRFAITSGPTPPSSSPGLCHACLDRPGDVRLEPCRHVCVCVDCEKELSTTSRVMCPICRQQISSEKSDPMSRRLHDA